MSGTLLQTGSVNELIEMIKIGLAGDYGLFVKGSTCRFIVQGHTHHPQLFYAYGKHTKKYNYYMNNGSWGVDNDEFTFTEVVQESSQDTNIRLNKFTIAEVNDNIVYKNIFDLKKSSIYTP